ncbi:MAG: signal peptidase I, partial [Planctomycetaceae bacterium]|nr:signal peptidase I [Planctomycetaceae bacterium]
TVTKSSDSEKKAQKPVRESESARETIESIVFAFVLAFLFRTFEAEAFVIPTGSMAPTLFGRHKDIACEQCGYEFQFGASSEVRRDANVVMDHSRVQKAACPNCRYRNKKAFKAPAYKGDRILVNKFQYELTDPKRFDVVVFKFPEDAKTNYIKRLVGLPGETIRIHNGNVYKLDENEKEIILRKDNPEKQRLIQIPVYDDTHPATALREAGWPARWAGVSRSAAKSETTVANWSETTEAWQADSEKHAYTIPLEVAHDGKTHWLRYRHFHPTHSQWERLENNDPLDPRPWLIGDYCGYNATASRDFPVEENEFFWVGDLTVSGKLEVEEIGPDADVVIELTEGFHLFRCHIDPNSGQARLTRVNESLNSEEEIELATVQTNLKGKGSYSFRYANVDDRLCLWIDNKFIDFGPEASYVSSDINELFPQETDLSPVGIAMTAVAGTVSSLLIERDIYYRAGYHEELHFRMPLDDVKAWQTTYMNRREEWDYLELKVPEENYLVLGDNSPASYDSRGWPSTNSFHRSAFVGKAFYIYWPHGIPMGVEDGWAIPISYNKKETSKGIVKDRSYPLHYIPFYPNFGRMRRIH